MNPGFWQHLVPQRMPAPVVDPRCRLRLLVMVFALMWLGIFARAVQLEWRYGNAFRAEALKPLRREIVLPALRGRILARDGAVLAADEQLQALAVHYRYLQQTPDETWLRNQARMRLPKAERRDRERLAAEMAALRTELRELNLRLAALSNLSPQAWRQRTASIEQRVEKIAASVNRRRWRQFEHEQFSADPAPQTVRQPWWNVAANLPDALTALATPEEPDWEPVIVLEEVDYHILVENLPQSVAAEIQEHADRYPGVRVLDVPRRTYPCNLLAANVVGHLQRRPRQTQLISRGDDPQASADADNALEMIGAMGIERVWEGQLRGVAGNAIEHIDRRGQLLSTARVRLPRHGRDVHLSIDAACQQAAEVLLDRAITARNGPVGGTVVLLDVHSGEVLALASGPRFNPNAFSLGDNGAITEALSDAGQPMFNRATRMALPPGELAQPFAVIAMLESGRVPAHVPFHCQGYLRDPDGVQCATYRQQGLGHGDVTLADALRGNCRVCLAHYAGVIPAEGFFRSVSRFGFGQTSEIELSQSVGSLPQPIAVENGAAEFATGEAQLLALGQGRFTATPLQMARAMAAIANGGKLIEPRLVVDDEMSHETTYASAAGSNLALVRQALAEAVSDREGAAHDALFVDGVPVAGLCATGEISGDAVGHAWCGGFVPADEPHYAFAIALEHGGSGKKRAGPLAKRLIQRLDQLGWFTVRASAGLDD